MYDVLFTDFEFDEKKEIRAFFNQLRQEFLDWHGTRMDTPEFDAQKQKIRDFYNAKAVN